MMAPVLWMPGSTPRSLPPIAATLKPLASAASRTTLPQTRGYIINMVRSISPDWLRLEFDHAAAAGFNLVLFPVLNNGWTLFPSQTAREYGLGRINPLLRGWDPLAEACRLARERDQLIWGYARAFNFHPRYAIAEHKLLHHYPEWRLRAHRDHHSARSRRNELWHPCPINPDYRRHVADLLTEGVGAYPLQGLVFYYSSYGLHGGPLATSPFCFCDSCKTQYREAHGGADLELDAAGERLGQVRAWQQRMSHETLGYLRHRILRMRRTLRLLCRARPFWRENPTRPDLTRDDIRLMDWPALLAQGMVDELLVDSDEEPVGPWLGSRLAADYACLGDRALFSPIVSLETALDLRHAMRLVHRYPIPGFYAEFQHTLDDREAALVRNSFFDDPAMVAETNPTVTAIWLLDQVRLRHQDHEALSSLMADTLRILTRQLPLPNDFQLLQVIEQNLAGLEQFIRRRRLEPARIEEETLRQLGLARRFVRLAALDVRA